MRSISQIYYPKSTQRRKDDDRAGGLTEKSGSPKSEAIEAWLTLYKRSGVDLSAISHVPRPTGYSKVLFDRVSREVRLLSQTGEPIEIWSAGSGYDFVSLRLKSEWNDLVDLTISDISPECIEYNRQLFAKFGLEANFVVGDIRSASYLKEFDVVTNTGLLEHFNRTEQEELIKCFSQSLKPGGVYLTLVPYSGAKVYNFCMNRSKKMGTWRYGPEEPISSLKYLETAEIILIEEFPVAATSQLHSMPAAFPVASKILRMVIPVIGALDLITEPILMRAISGYCLFGKFEKKKEI
jgi:SAM-dependent methyltransferase